VVYLIPAFATGLVAFRPKLIAKTPIIVLYGIALVAGFDGTAYFGLKAPGFWRQEVWWCQDRNESGVICPV
jgi:hypothetical protein